MNVHSKASDFSIAGKCVIFSAPSGAGKTSIVQYLLKQMDQLEFSVSATSRLPREGEQEGIDYYFLSKVEFAERIAKNAFVEWEEVYQDLFYGTFKSEMMRIWNDQKTVVFDVDVEGGIKLKHLFGKEALAVFVMPPSLSVLEQRLRKRSTEAEDSIQKRLGKAKGELKKAVAFDVVLLNENLEKACRDAHQLVADFVQKQ